jgi:hypothetical protein
MVVAQDSRVLLLPYSNGVGNGRKSYGSWRGSSEKGTGS